jgi:DNA-binding winged helix-turn-helix (wHTH) protein
MEQTDHLRFGPFRLDPRHKKLWRGEQEVILRARSFAVLHYLATHPGQLVSKEEVKKTLWAGIRVTNTVLRVCIREIRNALGDSAATPQFIETVARLGYRFIAEVVSSSQVSESVQEVLERNSAVVI